MGSRVEAFAQFVPAKTQGDLCNPLHSASFFQRHVNSPIESTQASEEHNKSITLRHGNALFVTDTERVCFVIGSMVYDRKYTTETAISHQVG